MRKLSSLSSYLPKAAAFALAGGMILLSGCGLGTVATSVTPAAVSGIQIDGTAFGGSTAISGATVTLYVSGNTGYGSTPTYSATASAKTAAGNGAFSFSPAFSTSSCTAPASQIVYLTVSGGDPTGVNATGTTNNHAILLASVLGVCSGLTNAASLHVAINEATTVAAAYALSGFTTVTSSAGGLASLSIGAPSTNSQGLLDAAANALLLVTSSSTTAGAAGNANASTAAVELPTAALDTVANAITGCVNASEYNVTPCSGTGGLFALTTPPGGTAPTNVYQATLNIAKYPGQNVAAIMQLPVGTSPFQPSLPVTTVNSTTAPNDLSLGIAYPNATQATAAGNSAVSLTIDGLDNIWVIGASNGTTASTHNYLTELSSSSAGGTYSNTLGTTQPLDGTHTLRNARFDATGNMWITDKNSTAGGVIELPKSGSTVNVAGATEYTFGIAALDQNDYDLAVDASGNVFTASYGAQGNCTLATSTTECYYVEFPAGSSYVAADTFGSSVQPAASVRGMAADTVATSAGLGSIWAADYGVFGASTGGTSVQVLNPSTGALTTVTLGTTADSPFGIALDKTGGAYIDTGATTATSALYYVAQGTGAPGTTGTGAAAPTVNASVTASVAVTGNSGSLSGIPNAATSTPASSASSPLAVGGLNSPGYVAVDGAGSVWLANYSYGSVVEYSPTLNGYLSPFYGFSPSIAVPAQTLTVTAVTLASTGTANIYYTGDTAINGQQVTFSGMTGAYAFLNGNTYTIGSTSFNYFTIPDGGQTLASKTTTTGTATIAATSQAVFQCGPYATSTTTAATTTCTTVGNAASRNNGIGIDRAGTVWTLGTNGTLVGLVGTAAPTDPVLADGKSGMLP